MVDKEQIKRLLQTYYSLTMEQVTVHGDGVVDVEGNVSLKKKTSSLMIHFGKVKGDFNCSRNTLTSLQGAPREVGGGFRCSRNQLKSLDGAPTMVGGGFYCSNNQLTSLTGAPNSVPEDLFCYDNPLNSLEGAPSHIGGEIWLNYSPQLPLLRCLVATKITMDQETEITASVEKILNDPRWVGKGKKGSLMCAAALIRAGYEGNAKW